MNAHDVYMDWYKGKEAIRELFILLDDLGIILFSAHMDGGWEVEKLG